MVTFTIRLAEIPIGVTALHASTRTFCRDYLTDEPTALQITMQQADIDAARKRSAEQNRMEGIPVISYSDAYLETLALYRRILDRLQDRNILLFHGSVLALEGGAYLFTAKSGTGKTTHTRLWLRNIPGTHVLNGDKPLLLFREDGVYACGTPWQGKENYGRNELLPLRGLCILTRDRTNHIEPLPFRAAMPTLLTQSHHDDYGASLLQAVRLLSRLQTVPLWRMGCNMEDEAALVACRAMTGKTEL